MHNSIIHLDKTVLEHELHKGLIWARLQNSYFHSQKYMIKLIKLYSESTKYYYGHMITLELNFGEKYRRKV